MVRNFSVTFRTLLIVLFIFSLVGDKALSQSLIHVDNQNPAASDSNTGSSSSPLKTIKKAAELANQINKNNTPVTVEVSAGTYRESVVFNNVSTKTSAPITFIAKPLGSVIVSGSDIWTGWIKESQSNIYSHSWPYNWGAPGNPGSNSSEIVKRREMVFINGESLKQVLSFNDLTDKSFYVNESADKIYVSSKVNPNNAKTEVAIRSALFVVNRRDNFNLKGFVFQHDTSPADNAAVRFIGTNNTLIEDTDFLWNNWVGLRVDKGVNVTVRRSVINNNGGKGSEVVFTKNLLFEDVEFSFNNWRGFMGGFTGYSVAGSKHLHNHGAVYRNILAIGNKSRGFWLDYDNADIEFDSLIAIDNFEGGISIEANQGPILIKNSAFCNNGKFGGILSSNSMNVTILDTVSYRNTGGQIRARGANIRPITDWETGEVFDGQAKNWTWTGSILVGEGLSELLINFEDNANLFLSTLKVNNNIYWNPTRPSAFRANGDTDFNGWKQKTGQEQNSVFADPTTLNLSNKQKDLLEICMNKEIPDTTDSIAPTSPSVLTAITISSSQINLSWGPSQDNVGVAGYRIYRNGSKIAETTGTFYSDTSLSPSTKYTYTITAYDAAGNESESSNQASATTLGGSSGLPPNAPSNLEITVP